MKYGIENVLVAFVFLHCIKSIVSLRIVCRATHRHILHPHVHHAHRKATLNNKPLMFVDKTTSVGIDNLQYFEVIVGEAELSGKRPRLDSYLSNKYPEHSRSQVINMCELGLVKINGKCKNKSYKVTANDHIQFAIQRKKISTVEPEDIPLDIIYEDDHLLAINKPKGMVVHPAIGSPNGTFVNALLYHLGVKRAEDWFQTTEIRHTLDSSQLCNTGQSLAKTILLKNTEDSTGLDLPETPEAAWASPLFLRPGIVHRLDKGTSGVLLAAKHPVALNKISKLFAERTVRKTYLAVCVGHPGDTTIALPLIRSPQNRQIITVSRGRGEDGKMAVTHTRTLCFDGKLSLVLIRIETGRTHQIRVHMQHRRTPILGDATYGNLAWNKLFASSHGIDRPLLHAYETQFVHPFTEELLTLRAPLPTDFRSIIDKICKQAIFPSPPSLRLLNNDSDWLKVYDKQTHLLLGSTFVRGRHEPPIIETVPWDVGDNSGDDLEEVEDLSIDFEDIEEFEVDGDYSYLDEEDDDDAYDFEENMEVSRIYVPLDRICRDDTGESKWFRKNLPEDEEAFRQEK